MKTELSVTFTEFIEPNTERWRALESFIWRIRLEPYPRPPLVWNPFPAQSSSPPESER